MADNHACHAVAPSDGQRAGLYGIFSPVQCDSFLFSLNLDFFNLTCLWPLFSVGTFVAKNNINTCSFLWVILLQRTMLDRFFLFLNILLFADLTK